MVARRYSRTRKQKGGSNAPHKQSKISRGSKFVTELGAVPHYLAKGTKLAVKGAAGIVAVPVAAGVSIVKAGTVAAATAAISTPIRAIQGAIKTPWQLARLGVQKGKEWSARRKLTTAGMHNYDKLGNRVSKRTQTLNALRTQRATLNTQQLQKQMSGTDKGLSSWWSSRQLARKDKAITNAEARLTKSIDHTATRTNTKYSSDIQNISTRAKKFIAELNTTKKRQMNAYNAKLTTKRVRNANSLTRNIAVLKSTNHDKRKAHTTATSTKDTAATDLEAYEKQLKAFTNLTPTSFKTDSTGTTVIEGTTYTRDEAIAAAKTLRDKIKTQTATLANATTAFNKSAKSVAALDAEADKLQKQKDAYMSQGKTAEQLYGSFQRRKARVQNTKEELVKTAQQLTGIATGKNIGRAVRESFQQDFRLAKQAMGLGDNSVVKQPGVLAAIGKSLTSSKKNLSSRYTAIKHGIEPIGLKIKTLWRGYVNNFSKQGKLLDKFAKDVDEEGALATEAQSIIKEYTNVPEGNVIPPKLRERHNALINKRGIMKNFADLIATNRSGAQNPNEKKFDESSRVAKGAKALSIILDPIDQATLVDNIKNAVNEHNKAQDYPSQMMYKELYNHLKSIKRWNASTEFGVKATTLTTKLNKLLPGLEVLPEFKPKLAPPIEKPSNNSSTKTIDSITRKYLNDPQRRGKIRGNPQKYLEKSIRDISNLRTRILIRSNPSAEEIQQYNNSIKDRQAILNHITKKPDFITSSNA